MPQIQLVVRTVIRSGGKILLCKLKTHDYWFLPGGHVERGESPDGTLVREMREELGAKVKNSKLLGIVENRFKKGTRELYEINFVYLVALKSNAVRGLEGHLEFRWMDIAALRRTKFQPLAIKRRLRSWSMKRET
jgi:8-oxo-dGTP diphosphatase